MRINLPENVNQIIHKLQKNGYEAYAVGGCIRDSLMGREPQDWDITTSASPQQVKKLFARTIDTGIQHGTVTVMFNHTGYEVTTYRIDGEYEDARHPKQVTFTSSLSEDLKRRDFTVNAMAYNEEAGLVDEFCGVDDLKDGVIRCVGNPKERFSEDALRMLRAVRFAAQLGFAIEPDTKAAAKELSGTIEKVSAERIQAELVKLLTSPCPEEIRTAYELKLTSVFLPEFDVMMETGQNNKHHMYSVGEHTIHAMQEVRPDKVLRLTMLFHDIAKPACLTTDEEGHNHFKRHPEVGAAMTKEILRRLKFDNDTTERVCRLVLYHDERPQSTEQNVRRAMSRVGTELFPLLFEVKRADILAQSMYHRAEKLEKLSQYEQQYRMILEAGQCVKKSDLAINGKDLMEIGIKPGRRMGEILNRLFEQVLDEPELNTREKLLEQAHKMTDPFI